MKTKSKLPKKFSKKWCESVQVPDFCLLASDCGCNAGNAYTDGIGGSPNSYCGNLDWSTCEGDDAFMITASIGAFTQCHLCVALDSCGNPVVSAGSLWGTGDDYPSYSLGYAEGCAITVTLSGQSCSSPPTLYLYFDDCDWGC